jgi:hypothetical protein
MRLYYLVLSPRANRVSDMGIPGLGKLIGSLVRRHFEYCYRCRKPSPSLPAVGWNIQTVLMYPIGVVCSDCQSPEERAESEIREATSTYTLESGRLIQHPKRIRLSWITPCDLRKTA